MDNDPGPHHQIRPLKAIRPIRMALEGKRPYDCRNCGDGTANASKVCTKCLKRRGYESAGVTQ